MQDNSRTGRNIETQPVSSFPVKGKMFQPVVDPVKTGEQLIVGIQYRQIFSRFHLEPIVGEWTLGIKIKNKQISASPENQYLSLIISYDRQWDRFKKAVFLC